MLRQCDDCKGVFRLSNMIEKYKLKYPDKIIFCPYCNGVSNHIYTKITKLDGYSRRGEMYLHFGKKYIENE